VPFSKAPRAKHFARLRQPLEIKMSGSRGCGREFELVNYQSVLDSLSIRASNSEPLFRLRSYKSDNQFLWRIGLTSPFRLKERTSISHACLDVGAFATCIVRVFLS
jgi:hypothetical protein